MKYLKLFAIVSLFVGSVENLFATQEQREVVVYAIDDNCVQDVAVSIKSMNEHTGIPIDYYVFNYTENQISGENKDKLTRLGLKNGSSVRVIDIERGIISEENKDKLTRLGLKNGSSVKVVDIPDTIIDEMKDLNKTSWNPCIFFKFFIPELLPQDVKKCLWLDADTIFVGDISGIFSTEMNGCPYMGVNMGLFVGKDGYNSGLLLIDCAVWREKNIGNILVENGFSMIAGIGRGRVPIKNFDNEDCETEIQDYPDDEIILSTTALISSQFDFLPYKYNVILKYCFPQVCRDFMDMQQSYIDVEAVLRGDKRQEILGELSSPVMLHFDTAIKPKELKEPLQKGLMYKNLGKSTLLQELSNCGILPKQYFDSFREMYHRDEPDMICIRHYFKELFPKNLVSSNRDFFKLVGKIAQERNPYKLYFDTLEKTPFSGQK